MLEITPKGKYCIVAAILGLFSFFLPWVSFTISNGVASATNGESPATVLSDFVTVPSFTPTTDSAILAWERAAQAGFDTWTVGSVIFLVACLVTFLQSFDSGRWGGFWMLIGVVVSAAGIGGMSAHFTTDAGYLASVGPSVGIGLAAIAALVALFPALKVDPRDKWVRDPEDYGWVRPKPTPAWTPTSGWSTMAPPTPTPYTAPTPDQQPPGAAAPSAAAPAGPGRRFCPDCGAWYFAGETACPRDGATLKPVQPAP